MCAPIALGLLSFAFSAIGSIAQYQGQMAVAKATEENAAKAYENDSRQLTKRQIQEQDAAGQKLQAMNLDEAERKAEVEVQGAEGGVAGLSLDGILRDVGARAARNREVERRNLTYTVDQLQFEKKGSQAQNQGRINNAPRPSPLALVAGIGSAAIDTFSSYKKKQFQYA